MSDGVALLSAGMVVAETYEIERLLGRGGMGEVWLARHLRLAGKQVAIKVLHLQGEATTEVLARFRREAEIAARLEHPNIVQVLDFNTLSTGQPFLVMEYLKGHSLSDRIKQGPLPIESAQNIVRQIGAALQTAHSAGVVHRDLKPENIFLLPTALGDQVKVLDFGISKLADSKTFQTTNSVLIGTPLYMSPEQATGANNEVTAQSDIFSLGSICYELLTGQAPFYADNVARVVFRIAYENHTPLTDLRPDLPANAVAAIEHALKKERHNRTENVEAFVTEFTGVPLAPRTGTHGVYTPGMKVSESILSGKTMNQKATPVASSALPAKPSTVTPTGSSVSGRLVAIALVVTTVALSAGVISVRQYWQHLPTPDAGVAEVDAGASVAMAKALEAPVDSGPAVELDAGAAAVAQQPERDAGVSAPTKVDVPVVEAPINEHDAAVIAELKKLSSQEAWNDIINKRSQVQGLQPRALRAALPYLIRAMCANADNGRLPQLVKDYRRIATAAERKALRGECIQTYESASAYDW